MAEEAKKDDEELQPRNNSMAAFSDKLKDLEEALSLLYIPRNLSGRLKFKDKWPEVAQYLFGDELIGYDINGFEDLDRRAKLEEEANDRRIRIKQTINEIVDKSVDAGSLMFDYVGSVIDEYGALMSKYLYAEDVIERVRPGLLASSEADAKAKAEVQDKPEVKAEPPAANGENGADDMQDTQTVSNVSDELDSNIEEADDINETAVLPEKEEDEKSESLRAPDEKLSQEEKALLSNNEDVPDSVKPIDTVAPAEQAPKPEAPKEQPKPIAEDPADSVKPIDTTPPPTPEEIAPFLSEDPEKVKAQAGLTPEPEKANAPAEQTAAPEVKKEEPQAAPLDAHVAPTQDTEKTESKSDMKPATQAEPKVDLLGDQKPTEVTPDVPVTEASPVQPAPPSETKPQDSAAVQEQAPSTPQTPEAPKVPDVAATPVGDTPAPTENKPPEAEQTAPRTTAPLPQETVEPTKTPDILKPPPAEKAPAAADKKPEKVEELTLPQAAKAEKGVYMAMFNALAKAV